MGSAAVGEGMNEAGANTLVVGYIAGVYGVKGWVRLHSYTDPQDNILGYGNWKVKRGGVWQSMAIDAGKRHGKGLVVHFAGIDDRAEAELLKGAQIVVPQAELADLEEGEFYWRQLQGLDVYTAGELLGKVDHLLETGANDVLVVKPCEGCRDKRERLIPWVMGSVILAVNLAQGRIDVEWDPEF
jgi:16S rRNA processing protein RimM